MTPNPPIKGHTLLSEGRIGAPFWNPDGKVYGGCRCGLAPLDWAEMSARGVQRWHRAHKAELRAAEMPKYHTGGVFKPPPGGPTAVLGPCEQILPRREIG